MLISQMPRTKRTPVLRPVALARPYSVVEEVEAMYRKVEEYEIKIAVSIIHANRISSHMHLSLLATIVCRRMSTVWIGMQCH